MTLGLVEGGGDAGQYLTEAEALELFARFLDGEGRQLCLHDADVYRFCDMVHELASVGGGRLCVPDFLGLLQNLSDALETGDPSFLSVRRGLRVGRIVSIDEFLTSRDFLGVGQVVRPKIREALIELFQEPSSYYEVVLGGAIGIGKTYMAVLGLAYMIYQLSCYTCPQLEFGMSPGAWIYFVLQSVREELARKTAFAELVGLISNSPYFRKVYPPDWGKQSELVFPNRVVVLPVSSSDTAALGLNVYGGILDELNFMSVVQNSRQSRGSETQYDQAEKLYTTIVRRLKSRFQSFGRVPGKLFLVSSANYPGDFIDRKMQEAREEAESGEARTIYVFSASQWEAIPDAFSGERFFVEVGDATRRSRILSSLAEAVDVESVIEVPVDFRREFERDLESALRDLAGIPVGGVHTFIRNRESIEEAAKAFTVLHEGRQLFVHSEVPWYSGLSLEGLLDLRFLEGVASESAPCAIHIDIGLASDSAGVAVGRVSGWSRVGRAVNWSDEEGRYVEVEGGEFPVIEILGVTAVVPTRGEGEIEISSLELLVQAIAQRLPVLWVTADSFQSVQMLQRLRLLQNRSRRRLHTGVLSVDATLGPYMEVKQALRDGRLLFPNVDRLKRELRELQLDPKRRKVDHPPSGSKDMADAVAGVVAVLLSKAKRGHGKVEDEVVSRRPRRRR